MLSWARKLVPAKVVALRRDWFIPARRGVCRLVTKLVRLLTIAAVLSGFIVFGALAAQPAQACDINNHCYGGMGTSPSGADGVYAQVQPLCLAVPLNNFTTDEVWLTSTAANYWVEVGFIDDNTNIRGLPTGYQLGFWYDHRPIDGGNPGNGHVLVTAPSLVNSTAWILNTAPNTFTVIFGPSNNYSGVSTDNTMVPGGVQYGSETTSNVTSSFSYYRAMSFHAGGVWNNPALPISVSADPPQIQQWYSLYTMMNAGSPC